MKELADSLTSLERDALINSTMLGGVMAAIVGVIGIANTNVTAKSRHKEQGYVRAVEHPKGYDKLDRSRDKQSLLKETAISGLLAAGATLFDKTNNTRFRQLMFFGSAGASMAGGSIKDGYSVPVSMVSAAAAVGIGKVAFDVARETSSWGYKALEGSVARAGGRASIKKFLDSVEIVKRQSPLFERLLSSEGIAFAAAIGAVPVAHRVIRGFLDQHSRRHKDSHPDAAVAPLQTQNQAGRTDMRGTPTVEFAAQPGYVNAKFSMRSTIRTSYNQQDIAAAFR